MATRTIIQIDEDLCNGCGLCANGCPEGALRIIDGKARMVGDSLCDGLGACIGDCPLGAITQIEREAEEYDEEKVIQNIIPKGAATILAHLDHLYSHGQDTWYHQAVDSLKAKGMAPAEGDLPHIKAAAKINIPAPLSGCASGACPGSAARAFNAAPTPTPQQNPSSGGGMRSTLEQWPVQLHLINPRAPYFRGADLLIAADCTAFACGAFHQTLLRGRRLVIACPKLDSGREIYIDKLRALINDSGVASITLAIMEVPCCGGLRGMLNEALNGATRQVPVETVVVGIEGGTLTPAH
jgi:NAD-dependent dihydropyrimidine dehydrogenase PreA subunit